MKQRIIAAAVAITVLVGTGAAAVTSRDVYGAPSDAPVGIPDSNPVKSPEDGNGTCEKHETVVKTTPSGKNVNVPCHAAR